MIVVYSSKQGDPYPPLDRIRSMTEEVKLLIAAGGCHYTIHEILRAAFVYHHEYPTNIYRVVIRDVA